MPVNVLDVQDAVLRGKQRFFKAVQKAIEDFNKPLTDTYAAVLLNSMDPEMKRQLARMNPAEYAVVAERFGLPTQEELEGMEVDDGN